MLTGNSSISLAGSKEQINFSQKSSKCLKWLQIASFKLCCCFPSTEPILIVGDFNLHVDVVGDAVAGDFLNIWNPWT